MERFLDEAASSPYPVLFFFFFFAFSIWSARLNRVPVGGPWGPEASCCLRACCLLSFPDVLGLRGERAWRTICQAVINKPFLMCLIHNLNINSSSLLQTSLHQSDPLQRVSMFMMYLWRGMVGGWCLNESVVFTLKGKVRDTWMGLCCSVACVWKKKFQGTCT